MHCVAFVDDNKHLQGLLMAGLPVYSPAKLASLKGRWDNPLVLVAMPSVSSARQKAIIADTRAVSDVPVAAYLVSGEVAMIEAASANGWSNRRAAILEAHRRGGAGGREWVRAGLDPARIAARIHAALEAAWAEPAPEDSLRHLPLPHGAAAAAGLALARTIPAPREARLWLDMALEPRAALLETLRQGGPSWRPEPCRREGGALRTAHAEAFGALGLPGPPPADGPAAMMPGDLLATQDPALRAQALALGVAVLPWRGTLRALIADAPSV